jgi:hypothetical protein
VIVLLLGAVAVASVAAANPDLVRRVLAGGGARLVSGDRTLTATIGRPLGGVHRNGTDTLCAGFWCGLGRYEIALPLILRT